MMVRHEDSEERGLPLADPPARWELDTSEPRPMGAHDGGANGLSSWGQLPDGLR